MEEVLQDRWLLPVRVIGWLAALPINFLTFIVKVVRGPYDPEKRPCPACLYKGCSVRCVPVKEAVRVMLEHECHRCFAKFYSNVAIASTVWLSKVTPDNQAEKIQEIIKSATL